MNTNIVVDDALINQAMYLTGLKTQKDVVEIALKTLIADKTRDKLASAFGQHPWEGDLEAMRSVNRWPDSVRKLAGVWQDFPDADALRQTGIHDVERESF